MDPDIERKWITLTNPQGIPYWLPPHRVIFEQRAQNKQIDFTSSVETVRELFLPPSFRFIVEQSEHSEQSEDEEVFDTNSFDALAADLAAVLEELDKGRL